MNDIIPAKGIGEFTLDMTYDEVISRLRQKQTAFTVEKLPRKIVTDELEFWADDEGNITQIMAKGGFDGKLCGKIGIGSTLGDVRRLIAPYRYEEYVYEIEGMSGICLEPDDECDGDEGDDTVIGYISVYKE